MQLYAPQNKDDIFKGALFLGLAVFMVSVQNAFAKFLSLNLHPVEVTFYRNGVILAGFLMWLHLSDQWHLTKTDHLPGHIYRSFVGTCGVVMAFWAVSELPLAEATTILYTAPLFVTLLSFPLLKEKVGWMRSLAVFAGFSGIILLAAPSAQDISWKGVAIALTAACFHALTQIQLRRLGKLSHPVTTVFYFMLIGTVLTGTFMPFVYSGPPSFEALPYLLLLAGAGIGQQILKTVSYAMAPAAAITPVNYSGLLWAVLLGMIFWNEHPTLSMLSGAGIIVAANLFILWRERHWRKSSRIPARSP